MQRLIIIRGAPASGKTTIAKKLRNFHKKIVWLKVDNFKDFFAENATCARKFVDETALVTLQYLINQGFSVVMEKIFLDPSPIAEAVKIAQKRNIPYRIFQIKCSLKTLQKRDRIRPGVKEGCRKPLGDKVIAEIHRNLEDTFYKGAIGLDTEKLSVDECLELIEKSFRNPK